MRNVVLRLLPQLTRRDHDLLSVLPRRTVWSTSLLGRLAHRLASFLLHTTRPAPLRTLSLAQPHSMELLLQRILSDLCLPAALAQELVATFQPLGVLHLQGEVLPYLPEEQCKLRPHPWNYRPLQDWALHGLPSPGKRALALLAIALKYVCGLDDQTERVRLLLLLLLLLLILLLILLQVWHHNLSLLHRKAGGDHFCFLSWQRLSKLRLLHLGSLCPRLRHQYRHLLPAQAPPLDLAAAARNLQVFTPPALLLLLPQARDSSASRGLAPQPLTTHVMTAAFQPLTSLLSSMVEDVTPQASLQASFQPLSSATALLLDSGVSPRLKDQMEQLMTFQTASLEVYTRHKVPEGVEEHEGGLETTWIASVAKFADLRGKSRREVLAWRRCRQDYRQDEGKRWRSKAEVKREKEARKNSSRLLEVSDFMVLGRGQQELVVLEGRQEFMKSLYRNYWSTERSAGGVHRPQVGLLSLVSIVSDGLYGRQ